MARLDRLVTAKAVAQYASVIGRQFSYELLQAVSGLDETTLQRELSRLVEAELVYQRGLLPQATYTFKHALVVDAAYHSLLKSTRQQYHQRIAQVLEVKLPESAETRPELIAYHCTEAGLIEQAIDYWHKAGQRASERSAHVEAIAHFRQGLELLQTSLVIPQRLQQELDIHIALGKELIGMKGYAALEVQQVYTHALTLCQMVEKPLQTYQVLRGLASSYLIRGELQTTLALRQQLLQIAQQQRDSAMLLDAHEGLGFVHHYLGELVLARVHYDQSMMLCDSQDGHFRHSLSAQHYIVTCQSHAAQNLWYLGYPDQALHTQRVALVLAKELVHPLTLAHTLCYAAFRHQRRREVVQVREYAEDMISLASEHGMALWEDYGIFLHGWALAMQGHEEDGLAQMHQGITTQRVTGAKLLVPGLLIILSEVYGQRGQPEVGLTTIEEALVLMHRSGECRDEAELHRLKGQLLLQQSLDNQAEAESCFQQAITIAQYQSAKSWELRASTSLARLWQSQGKRDEARELLEPVYSWFTEGFDTADLIDAKTLLDELEEGR
jgi:predicted ATPase